MNRAAKKIISRSGAVYVRCAVVILLLCMLLSAVLFYSGSMSVVRSVKRRLSEGIDGYLTGESVGLYGKLDDGSDLTESLMSDFDSVFFGTFDGLRRNADKSLSCIDGEGIEEYRICYPDIYLTGDGHLGIEADFRVEIPVTVGGVIVTHMSVPVHIRNHYVSKY